MKWKLATPLIFFAFLWFIPSLESFAANRESIYGESFESIIAKATIRLQKASRRRPLRLTSLNDSLAHTATAAHAMTRGQDIGTIRAELSEATKRHKANSIALLLDAIVSDANGDHSQANQQFENFLLNSQTFTDFEKSFLKPGEFHLLRRAVYDLLETRGISLADRQEEIRARVPFEALINYVIHSRVSDFAMNIALLFIIFGGGVFLVFAQLMGKDFSRPLFGGLVTMYVVCWIAYAIWIVDLVGGLPFGWSRHITIPVLLIGTALLLTIKSAISAWNEQRQPLADGYVRCSHCGAIVPNLTVECPACKKQIS